MSNHSFSNIDKIKKEILSSTPSSTDELEQFRIKYLGTKNIIKPLFSEIKDVPADLKKEYGVELNALKQLAEEKFNQILQSLQNEKQSSKFSGLDLTAPGFPLSVGSRHPISITLNKIIKIFEGIGFAVAEDREIEDDWQIGRAHV